ARKACARAEPMVGGEAAACGKRTVPLGANRVNAKQCQCGAHLGRAGHAERVCPRMSARSAYRPSTSTLSKLPRPKQESLPAEQECAEDVCADQVCSEDVYAERAEPSVSTRSLSKRGIAARRRMSGRRMSAPERVPAEQPLRKSGFARDVGAEQV